MLGFPKNRIKFLQKNIVPHSPSIKPDVFAVPDADMVGLKRKNELIGSNAALYDVLGH